MSVDDLRATPGRVGVWSGDLRGARRGEVRDAASELDALGFRALWVPGLDGRDVFDDVAELERAAPHSMVVIGVLGIWGHDPAEVGEQLHALDRDHGPRTIVGFGVSSPDSARAAGEDYGDPITTVARYLDRLDDAPEPVPAARRLLGALGPKMVDLGAHRAGGLHPFLVTPEYVVRARAQVGPGPLLAPHQAVVLETDPDRARNAARAALADVIASPAYQRNLRRIGFTDGDLVPGGSDHLIDTVVAWGTVDHISARVAAHLAAGADHVALHVVGGHRPLPLPQWRELAAFLPHPPAG